MIKIKHLTIAEYCKFSPGLTNFLGLVCLYGQLGLAQAMSNLHITEDNPAPPVVAATVLVGNPGCLYLHAGPYLQLG